MDSHKGIRASGKLYGFFSDFAEDDENCVELEEDCVELELSATDDLLTAGVICNELDDDTMTHIVFSDELDSGTYRSIWYSCANAESAAVQTRARVFPKRIKMLFALYYSPLGAAFFTKRRGLNSRGGNSNLSFPLTSVR